MSRASLYMDVRPVPDSAAFKNYEVNIVDCDANPFAKPVGSGLVFVYVALTELGPGVSYRDKAAKVPILGKNADWGSDIVDFRSQAWMALLVSVLRTQAERCDGFFFDTADGYWATEKLLPGTLAEFQMAEITLLRQLHLLFSNKKFIINRGFEIALQVPIYAFMCEGILWTHDAGTPRQQSTARTAEIVGLLNPIQNAGIPIYALDYPPAGQARAVVDQLVRFGYRALATTPDLDGTVLADDATTSPVVPATVPTPPDHYLVVESGTAAGLSLKVAAYAMEGWRPQGGVSIATGRYAQAVIR